MGILILYIISTVLCAVFGQVLYPEDPIVGQTWCLSVLILGEVVGIREKLDDMRRK